MNAPPYRPSHLVLVRPHVELLRLSLTRAKALGICPDATNDNGWKGGATRGSLATP